MYDEIIRRLERLPDRADVTRDDVIAYLAALDGVSDSQVISAREAGAEIGAVGRGVHLLRARIEDALSSTSIPTA